MSSTYTSENKYNHHIRHVLMLIYYQSTCIITTDTITTHLGQLHVILLYYQHAATPTNDEEEEEDTPLTYAHFRLSIFDMSIVMISLAAILDLAPRICRCIFPERPGFYFVYKRSIYVKSIVITCLVRE